MEEPKVYTLKEAELRSLLNGSFRNGVIDSYSSLYEMMENNFKNKVFTSKEQEEGFRLCQNLIYQAITSASNSLSSEKKQNV